MAVSCRIIARLLPAALVVFVVEPQVVHSAQNDAHHHEDVRQIENRVVHELQVEHIHHIAAENAVDHVADAAAQHQHGGAESQGVPDDLFYHQIHHGGQQHHRHRRQQAGLTGEAAPRRAGVVQAGELHHARQQRRRLSHL